MKLEYYECSVCHKKYSDSACTNEITNIVEYAHHTYTKFDAVEPDCTTIGNVEYYYCTVCEKYFNMDGLEIYDPFLPYKHELVKHNAKSATCTSDGNIEYYECSICHKKFSDITTTNEVTDVIIKSHGHNFQIDYLTKFYFYKIHDYTSKIDDDRWGLYNYDGSIKAIGTAVKNYIKALFTSKNT